MQGIAARIAEKWARIIAEVYAKQATPRLSVADQDLLARQLAKGLVLPIAGGGNWSVHANLVLNAWERRRGGEGPRLLEVNTQAGTVEMGSRPVGR
jgi:hypothetical protein